MGIVRLILCRVEQLLSLLDLLLQHIQLFFLFLVQRHSDDLIDGTREENGCRNSPRNTMLPASSLT